MQTVLLQKNWFDLFALGMSQCAQVLSLSTILTNINLQFNANLNQGKINAIVYIIHKNLYYYCKNICLGFQGKINHQKSLVIKEQLFYLQNFITDCARLNITPIEYAYLKLIALFDFGKYLPCCLALYLFRLSQYNK